MKKLDRFLLRDILSDGPAGTVYKADEVLPGDNRRTVALKVLPAFGRMTGETAAEQRFFGEVRALSQLAVHPHVVTIYAMGVTDGYPWLAMEYASQTVAQKIGDHPAEAAEVLRFLEQVGKGLAAMHAITPPVVHQDLKPANVLVDAVGNYKITDFSLATVTAAHKTAGLATVRYAPPEMLSSEFGRVGPATDLYALGHIAYEMALGNRACRMQFPAVYEGNSGKEPPPNKWMMWHASRDTRAAAAAGVIKGFPGTLSEIIAKLMAKPLEERYGSAEELLGDLAVAHSDLSGGVMELVPERPVGRAVAAPVGREAFPNIPPPIGGDAGTIPLAGAAPAAPAGVPADPNARYWVRLRGRVTGPFNLGTLQRQVKSGQISRFHQLSADQVTWKQATEIEGLYGPTVV